MDTAQKNATESPPNEQVAKPRRLRKWLLRIAGVFLLLVGAGAYLWFFQQTGHSAPTRPPAKVEASGDELLDSIRRGVEYLKVHQEADGGFSVGLLDPKPAMTALVVESLANAPVPYTEEEHAFLKRAAKAILSKQQENGSICTPSFRLNCYTTSISIMALKSLGNPAYADAIEKGKQYLLGIQRKMVEGDPTSGGVGYGEAGRVDGSNTAMWVEALKKAGVAEDSDAFKNAQKFFSRLQNNPETNDLPAEGIELSNDGGLMYRPGESKVMEKARSGKMIAKSYGMMSYAGLLSFIYTKVSKDDPRVQSAWQWVRHNYTLSENRNIGPDGLYYYYLTMAKALAAYGEPVIETADGRRHVWAEELSQRLMKLQKPDGSWRNDQSDRWREDDSVMVTAFGIRVLTICRKFMKENPAPAEPMPDAKAKGVEKE